MIQAENEILVPDGLAEPNKNSDKLPMTSNTRMLELLRERESLQKAQKEIESKIQNLQTKRAKEEEEFSKKQTKSELLKDIEEGKAKCSEIKKIYTVFWDYIH